jgi:hypothetical protein
VDEFPVTLEQIESHTAVVGSLLEVQAISTVMSALVNARGRGISRDGHTQPGHRQSDGLRRQRRT